MPRRLLIATYLTLLALPALAQVAVRDQPAKQPAKDPLARVETLLEDVRIHRALIGSSLTTRQLSRLLSTLEEADQELRAQERTNDRALAAHARILRRVKQRLAAGQNASDGPEARYRQAAAQAQTTLAKTRAKWLQEVRQALVGMANPDQLKAIAATAEALRSLDRTASWAASRTPESAGPTAIVSDQMDELRRVLPVDFPEAAREFARLFVRRPPPPRLNELTREQRADYRKQGGILKVYRRQYDVMLKPYTDLAERIRAISTLDYAIQREILAGTLMDALIQSRVRRQPESNDAKITRFVARYLLSPRTVSAVRERLGQPGS